MRKSLLSIVPAFALSLALVGCGDSTSSAPTLTSQDKSNLGTLPSMVASQMSSMSMYSNLASGKGTSIAETYKPVAGRKVGANCGSSAFDTSMVSDGMTMTMKITKADGSSFASCDEIATAYASASGIRMKMTMNMDQSQHGVTMTSTYDMLFLPNLATTGYTMNMTMSMDMSMTQQGRNFSLSIDPATIVMTAASKDATPTMDGTMTMTYMGLTVSKVKFNATGIVPSQTVDILKEGSKVATMEIDANGQAVVKDLSGAVITTQG